MSMITSIALVNRLGLETEGVWRALLDGATPVRPGTYPGPDHDGVDAGLASRTRIQSDPTTHVALHLSDRLLEAAPPASGPFDTGVMLANTFGGMTFGQRELSNLYRKGPRAVSPYQSFAWFFAANTGQVSIRHGLKGPSGTVSSEACGGLDAIGQADRLIAEGQPRMVTGAVDGSSAPFAVAVQYAHPAAAADPAARYQPLTTGSDGFVPGEGGCFLLLEDEAGVYASGRTGIARIVGHAAGFATRSTSDPGVVAARVLRAALAEAAVAPGDVGVVFADGSGAPDQDKEEAAYLAAVFDGDPVPVTVPKVAFGRLGAAGSATDTALAALAVSRRVIPPTAVPADADPVFGLDLVRETRPLHRPVAVVVSRGFGGFVSAMVVAAVG